MESNLKATPREVDFVSTTADIWTANNKNSPGVTETTLKHNKDREIFKYFKGLISQFNQRDPQTILRTVNPREAELLDAAAGVFIRFRLGGITFPPNIYYKIFTHRPITDLCANSPKDYTQLGLKKPMARQTNNGCPLMEVDRSRWYKRIENNSWRLFCCKVVPICEPIEIAADKKMDFHHSKLRRQQDVEKWRKRRKIEWLNQMYKEGRLQTHAAQQHLAMVVGSSAQEMMDTTEVKGDDDTQEWEIDELVAWTNTLSLDDYFEEWGRLACSHSSEMSKDVHAHQVRSKGVSWCG
ncbi:protein MFI-like [Symphorus nematophorus]